MKTKCVASARTCMPMKLRDPQQSLFAAGKYAAPLSRWHDGATIDHLGESLRLKLDTDHRLPTRDGGVLHLPLPPDATPRQIQDAASTWQRRGAEILFSQLIEAEVSARRATHGTAAITLSFSRHGSWIRADGQVLRVNWRLIEQPLNVIALALRRTVAQMPATLATQDMFAAFA